MKSLTVVDIDAAVEAFLQQVESRYGDVVFNTKTEKGRSDCASAAHEVKAQYKIISAVIDESRIKAKERLESLHEKVRAPLDEWEVATKK